MDAELAQRILSLDDIQLVRLLTLQAAEQSPEVLALAEQEANRRGVPIDEAFIPREHEPGAAGDAARWVAGGVPLACAHCKGDLLRERRVLLNTRGMSFLNLNWLNQGAHAMECAHCGLVQLFTVPPQRVAD